MKTNSYYKGRKRKYACQKQAILALLVCLSLSGSVSLAADTSAQGTGKTYDNVNKWSGDATEGDPITVKHLQGWSQD